jgi:hypothetical protein
MRKVMVVIGSLLALSRASLYAQDSSMAEEFGGYSYVNINTNSLQKASDWGGGTLCGPERGLRCRSGPKWLLQDLRDSRLRLRAFSMTIPIWLDRASTIE